MLFRKRLIYSFGSLLGYFLKKVNIFGITTCSYKKRNRHYNMQIRSKNQFFLFILWKHSQDIPPDRHSKTQNKNVVSRTTYRDLKLCSFTKKLIFGFEVRVQMSY